MDKMKLLDEVNAKTFGEFLEFKLLSGQTDEIVYKTILNVNNSKYLRIGRLFVEEDGSGILKSEYTEDEVVCPKKLSVPKELDGTYCIVRFLKDYHKKCLRATRINKLSEADNWTDEAIYKFYLEEYYKIEEREREKRLALEESVKQAAKKKEEEETKLRDEELMKLLGYIPKLRMRMRKSLNQPIVSFIEFKLPVDKEIVKQVFKLFGLTEQLNQNNMIKQSKYKDTWEFYDFSKIIRPGS